MFSFNECSLATDNFYLIWQHSIPISVMIFPQDEDVSLQDDANFSFEDDMDDVDDISWMPVLTLDKFLQFENFDLLPVAVMDEVLEILILLSNLPLPHSVLWNIYTSIQLSDILTPIQVAYFTEGF